MCSWLCRCRKVQVSEFLPLRGLAINVTIQTQTLLPAILRVSQGRFVKGKRAVNLRGRAGERCVALSPVNSLWLIPDIPVMGFPLTCRRHLISSHWPLLVPFLSFCLLPFHSKLVERSISKWPATTWRLRRHQCERLAHLPASQIPPRVSLPSNCLFLVWVTGSMRHWRMASI